MARKVAILTPSYEGKVVCNFAISMAEVYRSAHLYDMEIYLQFWMYEALIHKARNNLFDYAHKMDVDDVVFIDADQSFNADAFYRILSHPVDVVGLPVRMKTEEERYNIRPESVDNHTFNMQLGLLEVENIGTGFLRLSSKALKALRNCSETYNEDGEERKLICCPQLVNGGMISEDIQICSKLRQSNIKIYADIRNTCNHFGMKCYEGNYEKYIAVKLIDSFYKGK